MIGEPLADLRGIATWERASTVAERSASLRPGEVFGFLMELDPRALIVQLTQLRPGEFCFEHRKLRDGEWQVNVRRVAHADTAPSLARALQQNPVLSLLDADHRAILCEGMEIHSARKGAVLLNEGDTVKYTGLLIDGSFGVFLGAGGRERLLWQIYQNEMFSETELLDEASSIGRLVVLSRTAHYALLPIEVARETLLRNNEFLRALAGRAAQHTRTLAAALAAQVSEPILSRIAAALLPYAPPQRGLQPALPPLTTMTQSQIAASAGTVKEVAARAIGRLENAGALKRDRGHIAFLDRAKLLEIGNGAV